jgi:hypothetical protein
VSCGGNSVGGPCLSSRRESIDEASSLARDFGYAHCVSPSTALVESGRLMVLVEVEVAAKKFIITKSRVRHLTNIELWSGTLMKGVNSNLRLPTC